MRFGGPCLSLVIVAAAAFAPLVGDGLPDGVWETRPDGKLDWARGRLFVLGEGTPAPDAKGLRKQLTARNAAREQALLSFQRVAETLAPAEEKPTEVQLGRLREVFQTSRVHTKDAPETQAAGYEHLGWDAGAQRFRVVVEVPLFGGRSVAAAFASVPLPPPDVPEPEQVVGGQARGAGVTGLVVDCAGAPVKPSLSPVILVEGTAKPVYGPETVDREVAIRVGLARYYPSVESARKATARVGANPLVVRALRADGFAATISAEDAARVEESDKDGGFLKRCAVVFVVPATP